MANVLITYDVSARNPEVKAALKALGYMDSWESEGVTYNLPNTTLWKQGSAQQGKTDMVSVAASLRVTLERAIAVEFSNWSGIPGQPHR